MSDNSASQRPSPGEKVGRHIRLSYPSKKADLIGSCLRVAFDNSDRQEDENDSLDKLLELLR